jgi:hypothetical protein
MKEFIIVALIILVFVAGNIAVYFVATRPPVTSGYKENKVKDSVWSSCVDEGGYYKITGNKPLDEDTNAKEQVVMTEAMYKLLQKAHQEEQKEIDDQKKYIYSYDDTTVWIGFVPIAPKYNRRLICYRINKDKIIVKDSSAAAMRYVVEIMLRDHVMLDSLIRHEYYMDKYFH